MNGKVRGRIAGLPTPAESEVVATALADARVQAAIAGKKIRRTYVVPGRLVNLVA